MMNSCFRVRVELARERDRSRSRDRGGYGRRRSPSPRGRYGGRSGDRGGGDRGFRRGVPPGRKTDYRLLIENLSSRTSWQVNSNEEMTFYEVFIQFLS